MGERKPYFLFLVVFVSGLAVMAIEMSASRLLAPYFGTSLFVWTNLIGVTMIALTVGYYSGGALADRYPRAELLYWLLFAAGILIVLIPLIAHPIMQFAVTAIDSLDTGLFLWSLFATIALFFIPLMALGMTAPYAIRISAREIKTIGNTSGSIYALSNVGSILGTFIPALLTIPLFGTTRTIIGCGVALIALSVIGLRKRMLHAVTLIAAVLLFLSGPIKETAGMIDERESVYNYIQVIEHSGGTRELRLNEGHATHSVYNPESVFTGSVWDYFSLFPLLNPAGDRALIIGLAGGTVSRAYAQLYPYIQIDGVEIDPEILEVGKQYFGINAEEQPTLTPIAADGRTFLKRTVEHYDFIYIDAYKQPYIPFHLATQEFFREVQQHLEEGGIVAINVGSPSPRTDILWAIANTMASVFAEVQVIPVQGSFNYLIMASDAEYDLRTITERSDLPEGMASIVRKMAHQYRAYAFNSESPVFTDDRAPVELFTEKMIIDYARG